ncbi:MAG: potassium channel family protein [Christensenellales bacterium]|nr:TrkA family potassium uptake protein [Clostridiales bacterium]
MFRRKKSDAITYGIVGLGRFGYALAMELAAFGADIMVMDSDEDKVRAMREYTEDAYVVKSHDKKTLSETGIQNCDIAIVCMGEKMDTSILNTLTLVSLGIPKVIAKASSAEHGEILERLGAEVVYPERDMALRLAHRLESSSVLDFVQLSEKVNISKIIVPDSIADKTVLAVDFRGRFGINIIAIENHSGVQQKINPGYKFQKGDILYVSGDKPSLSHFMEWAKKG